ncbi:MAG: hypothetical protein HKN48_00810, partial [Flavobacteriaceae bacterium]|nr:hypothetical protein [Flavobacteriaceae bacterium]
NLLNLHNNYNSSIRVDLLTREIIFTDKFSVLKGYFDEVEFRRYNESMGIFCIDATDCLRSNDTESGDRESPRKRYTFGIKRNGVAIPETDIAISKLNAMLQNLQGKSVPSVPNPVSSEVQTQLSIINNAFNQYNSYGTVFSVKSGRLHWDSLVANVSGAIKDLTFYIDYDNKWIVMKCVSGDCLEGGINKGSYSMGLQTSNGDIAPNIENVLQAFNTLRREVLTR